MRLQGGWTAPVTAWTKGSQISLSAVEMLKKAAAQDPTAQMQNEDAKFPTSLLQHGGSPSLYLQRTLYIDCYQLSTLLLQRGEMKDKGICVSDIRLILLLQCMGNRHCQKEPSLQWKGRARLLSGIQYG